MLLLLFVRLCLLSQLSLLMLCFNNCNLHWFINWRVVHILCFSVIVISILNVIEVLTINMIIVITLYLVFINITNIIMIIDFNTWNALITFISFTFIHIFNLFSLLNTFTHNAILLLFYGILLILYATFRWKFRRHNSGKVSIDTSFNLFHLLLNWLFEILNTLTSCHLIILTILRINNHLSTSWTMSIRSNSLGRRLFLFKVSTNWALRWMLLNCSYNNFTVFHSRFFQHTLLRRSNWFTSI